MDVLRIALCQIEIALGNPSANFSSARRLLTEAKQQGVHLALLPELWTTGYDLQNAPQLGRAITGDSNELAGLAREFELYLCSSTLEAKDNKYFNTQTIYSPEGKLLGSYRKIHLFGLLDEPKFLSPGEEPVVLDLPWGRTGLSICYDLRFPELFRSYAVSGARVILICAEWPHPRLEHWRTLLRARAIENQSYVVACNAVGTASNNVFFGHSLVVDPWGEIIVEGQETEDLITAEIDVSMVDQIRARFPFLADRRPAVYSLPQE